MVATQRIKHSGINLEMKDLDPENYKILMN